MASEFEDPRKELLGDLLQWLEWQAVCGGEVWPVEDIGVWNHRLPKTNRTKVARRGTPIGSKPAFLQRSSSKRGDTAGSGFLTRSSLSSTPSDSEQTAPNQPSTAKSRKKPKRALASAFSSFLEARPPSIDFAQLDEKSGLNIIKEHQQKHCSSDTPCAIGGGKPTNPVLVIEGHAQGLTQAARESLGKIMDNVLKIPPTKMYWLPYPIKSSGALP